MSLDAQKKAFIRWYGGRFHYDPRHDETFQFGLVISPGALRFRRVARLVQQHWRGALVAIGIVALVIALV